MSFLGKLFTPVKQVILDSLAKNEPFHKAYSKVREFIGAVKANLAHQEFEEESKRRRAERPLQRLDENRFVPPSLRVATNMNLQRRFMWKFSVDIEYDEGFIEHGQIYSVVSDRHLTIHEAQEELKQTVFANMTKYDAPIRELTNFTPIAVYERK